ncbi:hypothetical protein PHISP_07783 [Aspergillus sp. HF37]|nr:hypothetical protein PHISP_07783 [Aspergillus sp. HF37]
MPSREEEVYATFFHDPSWPDTWSHEELTTSNPERKRHWRTQPWYDQNRLAAKFLRRSCNQSWPWGYVIYRTVYTPESDTHWSAALAKFNRYIHYEIDAERRHGSEETDLYPERLVNDMYRNVVFSDKDRFDGASIEQIREHFNQWKESHEFEAGVTYSGSLTRYNVCLIVDEKALSSLVGSVEPGKREFRDPHGHCITVDSNYNGGDYDNPGYKGFMFVEGGCFWLLYVYLGGLGMSELCPFVREGQIPLFDGHNGKAVNKDGKVVMVDWRWQR